MTGNHPEHKILYRLLQQAGWPARIGDERITYHIADGNDAYAKMEIDGKEVRLELVPGRTDCFVIAKYDGEPLPEDHPLHMLNPPFEAALVALTDFGPADPTD